MYENVSYHMVYKRSTMRRHCCNFVQRRMTPDTCARAVALLEAQSVSERLRIVSDGLSCSNGRLRAILVLRNTLGHSDALNGYGDDPEDNDPSAMA